jgi:predicted nucleotidyltransferase
VYAQDDSKKYTSLKPLKETIDGFSQNRLYNWHGWDIMKTLRLLNQMNPCIIEWLNSPIVYLKRDLNFVKTAKELLNEQKRISPLLHHYRSMLKSNFKAHIAGKQFVKIKKYMNVIRSAGMFEWVLLLKCEQKGENGDRNFLIEIDFNKVLTELKDHIEADCYENILKVIEKKKKLINGLDDLELSDKPPLDNYDIFLHEILEALRCVKLDHVF